VKPGRTELREIPDPKPSHGEILIRIKAALTCGTDLKAFKRGHPVIPMPGVFGHEFSGTVAKAGKGVRGFRAGDEIMAVHSAPCLECRYCRKSLYNLCENIMNTKILGAFAEYILLPTHIVKQNTFKKPKHLSFEEAAFLEPLSCVVHGMGSLNIKKGDYALVIGSGPIGLLHLMLLKEKGAVVAVTDKHKNKLKIAKKLGADFVLISNPPSPPFIKVGQKGITTENIPHFGKDPSFIPHFGKGGQGGILRKNIFTDFIGFDSIFECTGMPEVWEASVHYVRRGGTVVLFGGCKPGTTVTYDAGKLHYDEITLKGTFHYTPSDVRKAYNLLSERKINVSNLISGSYPLRLTQKAFDKLNKGIGIKYAIIP
jgi:L-iditol 2-dehydrogenase